MVGVALGDYRPPSMLEQPAKISRMPAMMMAKLLHPQVG